MWSKLRMWSTMAIIVLSTAMIPSAMATFLPPALATQSPSNVDTVTSRKLPALSGIYDFKEVDAGVNVAQIPTECPQAGLPNPPSPGPLDQVERISDRGDDRRANQDTSCFPQNETSIAINPRNPRNVVGGANDYRLGWGTSGFYASTDGGQRWRDGIIPFPSLPNGDNLDGGGDPALVFDRAGVVYYADINFNRTDDTNGVFVSRSTNGGFTWTRPCVPIALELPDDDEAVCGAPGDPRQPGDGVITFTLDVDFEANGNVSFNDKEYIAAGPRPEGVEPVCFGPETRLPVDCDPAQVGTDRLYVTWTLFNTFETPETSNSNIYLSYSDDQARSWSPPQAISGSAPFCLGINQDDACDANQFSVPTVNPSTGFLYVAFENFNTPDENQYLLVRSEDGGQTFEGPFFVSPVFDRNYPYAGSDPEDDPGTRPDCNARGQVGRPVLTNSCFRVIAAGNIVVDKRGGAFADDLYLVLSDNRNGTIASSNTDVFLFKSTDGGSTWIGPTRVNDDRTPNPEGFNRDCGRDPENNTLNPEACTVLATGNDQWFPWVDINERGDLNVVFYDRRLDTDSEAIEWPDSRQRPGNYLTWFWGAQCTVTDPDSQECLADEAEVITDPTGLVDPGPDPVPGQNQTTFPFRNFTLSDVPSNMDYAFRAGLFIGDYNNVAVQDRRAYGFWTDARNGRSSRQQQGRNPACEQADVFLDVYDARDGGTVDRARSTDQLFLVTPCPGWDDTATPEPAP